MSPTPDETTARSRPRLLFLAHLLPYPLRTGVAIRTWHVLRLLGEHFDVDALCFDKHPDPWEGMRRADRLAGLANVQSAEAVEVAAVGSRPRFVADHLRSALTGRSFVHFVYRSDAFGRRLDALLAAHRYAIVHADSLDLADWLPRLAGLPVACTHHNVESALFVRRAAAERSAFARWYVGLQARLVAADERRWLGRVALNIAVSAADADAFRAMVPQARIEVLPNGVDTAYYQPGDGGGAGAVFVGGTTWFPNRDGLEWFAAEILPRLRAASPPVPVTWVGQNSAADQAAFGRVPGLSLTGMVPDVRPYVDAADCVIVPLRVGGGTRLKILEAWASGKAVVSTRVGCEGLLVRDGENILLADTAEEFAAAIVRLREDAALRRRLGAAARRTAEEHYAWDVLGRRLATLYRGVIDGRAAGSA